MHLLRGEEELPAAEGFVWLAREGSSAVGVASAESGGAGYTSTRGGWAEARCLLVSARAGRRLVTPQSSRRACLALPTRLFGFGLEQVPGPASRRIKWA